MATLTCGHESPAKFKITVCEYWICVDRTVICRSIVTRCAGDWTRKVDEGPLAFGLCGLTLIGFWRPGGKGGTVISFSTVSIQKVAGMNLNAGH